MSDARWFALVRGRRYGPVDLGALREWVRAYRVTRKTLLGRPGLADWWPAEGIPEAAELLRAAGYRVDDGAPEPPAGGDDRPPPSPTRPASQDGTELPSDSQDDGAPPVDPTEIDRAARDDAWTDGASASEDGVAGTTVDHRPLQQAVGAVAPATPADEAPLPLPDLAARPLTGAASAAPEVAPAGVEPRSPPAATPSGSGFSAAPLDLAAPLYRDMTAALLTAGLALPWLWHGVLTRCAAATRVSGRPVRYVGRARDLYGHALRLAALTLLSAGLYLPWAVADNARWLSARLRIGGAVPQCGAVGSRLVRPVCGAALLTLFTAGLGWPWAAERVLRSLAPSLRLDDRPLRWSGAPGTRGRELAVDLPLCLITIGLWAPIALCRACRHHAQAWSIPKG